MKAGNGGHQIKAQRAASWQHRRTDPPPSQSPSVDRRATSDAITARTASNNRRHPVTTRRNWGVDSHSKATVSTRNEDLTVPPREAPTSSQRPLPKAKPDHPGSELRRYHDCDRKDTAVRTWTKHPR